MSDTPWTDNHERVGKIRSSGAVMGVVPAVYVRELETELADARAEIARKDKLIEQMRVELKGFVDIMKILTRNSDKTSSNEFTNAMLVCIDRNELIIKDALSAAERGE